MFLEDRVEHFPETEFLQSRRQTVVHLADDLLGIESLNKKTQKRKTDSKISFLRSFP